MNYFIKVTEKYLTDDDKDPIIEDILAINVLGRVNSFWVYNMAKDYVKKYLFKGGSVFYIYLYKGPNETGYLRPIDSCVCRGGVDDQEWVQNVNDFINHEVISEKGLYHNKE